MIKAVLVDIDNTLLDFDKCAKKAIFSTCEDVGVSDPENLFVKFSEINPLLWQKIERGELTKDELHRDRFNYIFSKMGIIADGVLFEKLFREKLKSIAETVDGAAETLEYLHGKYYVGVASNAFYNQQYTRIKLAGLDEFVDGYFISSSIGYEKPSENFFSACLKEIESKIGKVLPQETVMIGDSLTADIKGGINAKMTTVWFNPKGKLDDENLRPDFEIRTLPEISKIL